MMKALKIIGVIAGVLMAAILIVPLLIPAVAEVSAETEIALKPSEIFPEVASYKDRELWDPWVSADTTAVVIIDSKPGYVGSTYEWSGEKLGSGKMEVTSVIENRQINSDLNFSGMGTTSKVQWTFDPVEGGTLVVWSFTQETAYPFGRLGMVFGKMFLKKSFETGLANLKKMMELAPRTSSTLGPVTIQTQESMVAMAAEGAGTMETIGEQLGNLYGLIMEEIGKQDLQVAGAPFVHYLDYDELTGYSNYVAAIPVVKPGRIAGNVHPAAYPEMRVVRALHTGPYEEFSLSYDKMDQYVKSSGLIITGEAFEFYLTDPGSVPDPSIWQTIIAFPLK